MGFTALNKTWSGRSNGVKHILFWPLIMEVSMKPQNITYKGVIKINFPLITVLDLSLNIGHILLSCFRPSGLHDNINSTIRYSTLCRSLSDNIGGIMLSQGSNWWTLFRLCSKFRTPGGRNNRTDWAMSIFINIRYHGCLSQLDTTITSSISNFHKADRMGPTGWNIHNKLYLFLYRLKTSMWYAYGSSCQDPYFLIMWLSIEAKRYNMNKHTFETSNKQCVNAMIIQLDFKTP